MADGLDKAEAPGGGVMATASYGGFPISGYPGARRTRYTTSSAEGCGVTPSCQPHAAESGRRPNQWSLDEEVSLAASIQARLLPAVLPELAGCELAARYRPAFSCGGDYYDVLPTSEVGDRLPYLLCVADVSGNGLPAALLMSNLQATLHTALWYRPALVDLVVRTNSLLHAATPADRYVTAILVNFDPATGSCNFVNAGHNGGVVVRADGGIEVLNTTGPPLGLLPHLPFASGKVLLHRGDVLNLYSDGAPEAFNSRDEEWGGERLMLCLSRHRHLSPERIISEVLDEIDNFTGDAPQHDDITMLVLKRRP